ncbi:hypothetical protein [Legionella saoudiensis]|uniref:hypothetical protein n=1 Tax=Legionella saoudiensis TaxID=1750561 RepID=UPI000730866E|nr:hypothetical protein [Legionella saoudiensis]
MSNIGGRLFTPPNAKKTAKRIVQFFKAAPQISQVNEYNQALADLRENLINAKTPEDLVTTTYQMIDLQKKVRTYLANKKAELQINISAEVENEILQLLERQENANIKILFTYTDMAAKSISETAEKIAIDEMYSSLNDDKQIGAKQFIDSLKALQGVASQMMIKYEEFAERLREAKDTDEIDLIEERIDKLQRFLTDEFRNLVSIPNDQETRQAAITVVYKNPSLYNVLMAFRPQEVLANNLLRARAEAYSGAPLSPSP